VDQLDLEKSLAFYKERFADASDFRFVFVGTFDLAAIKPLVEQYLGSLPSTRRVETWKNVGIRPPTGVVQKTVMKGLEPKSQAGIVFTGPFAYDPQHRVIIRALGDIVQTRLRDLVREELGGTYSIGAAASYTRVPEQRYSLRVQWGCNPDRVGELVKAVFADIADLRAKGPTEKQVSDVREQMLRDFETNIKLNNYLVTQIYFKYLYGEDLKTFFEMPETVKTLTPAVIQEAAQAYLTPENYVQVTLLPEARTAPSLVEQIARLLWPPLARPQPAPAF
jgi:zinc protease